MHITEAWRPNAAAFACALLASFAPPGRSRLRKLWRGKAVRWAAGAVLVIVIGILVLSRSSAPPVPPLSIYSEPVQLGDQGLSMATAKGYQPSSQLLHLMSRPGAAVSPQFVQDVRAGGGVNVEQISVRLLVQGHVSQGIRILDIHPVRLQRTAPLDGTLFLDTSQGETPNIPMMFDLDEPVPLARDAIWNVNAQSGNDLRQPLPDDFIGPQPGRPFFDKATITLANGESRVIEIQVQVTRFYVAFDLEIDYTVDGSDGTEMKAIVKDHSQPFRVTGMAPGPEPDTASYQRAFLRRGSDYSMCEVSDPHLIGTSITAPQPKCR